MRIEIIPIQDPMFVGGCAFLVQYEGFKKVFYTGLTSTPYHGIDNNTKYVLLDRIRRHLDNVINSSDHFIKLTNDVEI